MEFKGTKGKWEIIEYSSGDIEVGNLQGDLVCSIPSIFETTIPNAKLIAASPEMFEFIASLENDDNSLPKWLWDRRNKLLTKITE